MRLGGADKEIARSFQGENLSGRNFDIGIGMKLTLERPATARSIEMRREK
jgi:hypothetical protein